MRFAMVKGWWESLNFPAVPNRMQKIVGLSLGFIALVSTPAIGAKSQNSQLPQSDLFPQVRPDASALGQQVPTTPVWKLAQPEVVLLPVNPDPQVSDSSRTIQPITKLSGEAVFSLLYPTGDAEESTRVNLGNRIRLNIETSFSGEDQLRLRLQTVNVAELDEVFDTDLARLAIQGDDEDEFDLSRLDYRFPLGDRTTVTIPVVGGSVSDIADAINPVFDSSGNGSLSRFGQRNPIFRQGGGAGIGISHELNDQLNLSVGYLSNADNLLLDEDTVAFAQLAIEPTDTVNLGLLYSYGVNSLDTGTGTAIANDPFEGQSDAITSHSVGLQASANLTPDLVLSGWAGWTRAIATDLPDNPESDILNWAMTLGYLDFLGEGNQAGLVIGQPPQVLESQPPLHVELSYKIQMQDYLTITPGIVVTQSETPASPIVTGVIRSTFQF